MKATCPRTIWCKHGQGDFLGMSYSVSARRGFTMRIRPLGDRFVGMWDKGHPRLRWTLIGPTYPTLAAAKQQTTQRCREYMEVWHGVS